MLAGASGTWPAIVETGEEGGQWKEGEWSMVEEELRRFMTIQTI